MSKRNKDKLIESYSEEGYFTEPDQNVVIVNPTPHKELRKKLDDAEKRFKDIYQWLISNDALEEESEEEYSFRVINEIRDVKDIIDEFFRETV